jgi:hypothetical protein
MNINKSLRLLPLLLLTITISIVLSFSISWSATYYIDYQNGSDSNNGTSTSTAWKRCPGMKGFSGSYSHLAGDIFVFKGGVTWPSSVLPLTLGYSGSAGNIGTYISGHRASDVALSNWGTGNAVLDGEETVIHLIEMLVPKSYITINGIKLYRAGNPPSGSDNSAIVFNGPDHFTIKNCAFETHSGYSILIGANDSNDTSTIEIANNTFTNSGHWAFFGGSQYHVMDNIKMHDNSGTGNSSSYGFSEAHPDGIQFGNFSSHTTPIGPGGDYSFTNLEIYNNHFHGNWYQGFEGQIFIQKCCKGVKIYNNVLGFDNTTSWRGDVDGNFASAFIEIDDCKNVEIYNNSMSSTPINTSQKGVVACINLVNQVSTATIKGNTMKDCRYLVVKDANCSSITFNYNDYSIRSTGYYAAWNGISYTNWATYRSTSGQEVNGINGDPLYVSAGNPQDLRLQSSSPCKDAFPTAKAPTSIFTTDISGVSRPQGSAWDIGAYEFSSDSSAPSLPKPKDLLKP